MKTLNRVKKAIIFLIKKRQNSFARDRKMAALRKSMKIAILVILKHLILAESAKMALDLKAINA